MTQQIVKFNKLHMSYGKLFEGLINHLTLSNVQFVILYVVEEFKKIGKKVCTQKDITEHTKYSKQTINNGVKELAEKGYITLTPDNVDKRCKCIEITDKGYENFNKDLKRVIKTEVRAFSHLDENERDDLILLLNKLSIHLEEEVSVLSK